MMTPLATTSMARETDLNSMDAGQAMYGWMSELYPICRSITGNGVRETLRRIAEIIPLQIREIPSGTKVFDWTVPREWNIRDAWVKDSTGKRIIDFRRCNLHVVNYSIPVHRRMSLQELKPHLHSLPDCPEWIPYRTSYYDETWGFCLAHRELEALQDGEYEVCIDATLENGHLSYGEFALPGRSSDEILISAHICHPSLCNDNLSGIVVAAALASSLQSATRRHSYRFLFAPGTIGAITWLAVNADAVSRIRGGVVLAGIGDSAPLTYKKSRRANTEIDRAMEQALRHSGVPHALVDFSPYGYDERQYCSPGFDLAVGRLSRAPHGQFPEYHTSADNLAFVSPASLMSSLRVCLDAFFILENDCFYSNLNPKCEPQLGKRGLYGAISRTMDSHCNEMAMLWTLNLSDGQHSLLDIAERSGLSFNTIRQAATLLREYKLLREISG
jgi:aminopeptidase-like protein